MGESSQHREATVSIRADLVYHARDSSSASVADFTPFASFYTPRFSAYLHFSDAPVVVSHNELSFRVSFRVSFRYTINLSFLFFTLSNFLATPTMNFFSCLKKQICILCQRNSSNVLYHVKNSKFKIQNLRIFISSINFYILILIISISYMYII